MTSPASLHVESLFDDATSTFSHIVLDRASGQCALIDSVLDYDPASGRTSTASAERLIARVRALGANVQWLLETHVHADHLSAAPLLQAELGGRLAIGRHITTVQRTFGRLFNAGPGFACDGSQFDHLFDDDACFHIGGLAARAWHTPGHTPACLTYVVEDGGDRAAFIGDTLFAPDCGSARTDFPGGDARTLYRSIQRLLSLPDDTRLFLCHDYPPAGRAVKSHHTVAEQRANMHLKDCADEDAFVAMREARDRTLAVPRLMLPAVQVNMRAGHLPPPEDNGMRYLKVPLNGL